MSSPAPLFEPYRHTAGTRGIATDA